MVKRYCDKCGQQIDDGIHSWYVVELHGTDGELRRKEICEECYAIACEDGCVPKVAEQTEPSAQEYEKWLFKEPSRAEQTELQKWETPPKFEHKGIITTCVSVPLVLIEDEIQMEREGE